MLSKYFGYKNGSYSVGGLVKGCRPNNQSDPEVLTKVANRIKKQRLEPGVEFTDVQELFVSSEEICRGTKIKFQTKNKTDQCHNISVNAMSKMIVGSLNKPTQGHDKEASEFFSAILSSPGFGTFLSQNPAKSHVFPSL